MQYEIPLGNAKKIRNDLFHQLNDGLKSGFSSYAGKNGGLRTPAEINACNNGLFSNEERQALVGFQGINNIKNNFQNSVFS